MDIIYEWDIEEVDSKTFEIIEHDHHWSLKRLSHYALTLGENPDIFHRLVLVRDEFRGHNRVNRSWCYVTDRGTLPKTTDNGYEIPKKYKAEFDKNKSWASKLRNRTCICGGILDFEDGLWVCVNPDCPVISRS